MMRAWENSCYGEQWMLVQVTVKKARNKGIKARNVEKVKRIEIQKENLVNNSRGKSDYLPRLATRLSKGFFFHWQQ